MLKGKWLNQALHLLVCALVFFISFPYGFAAATIVLLILTWLLQANFKETFFSLRSRPMLWAWMIYFILHATSYFYSSNTDQSLFDLQSKLSFFILPIVIGAGIRFDKKALERILVFLIAGMSCIAVFCIIQAAVRCHYAGYLYTPFFFYHELVHGLDANAVYVAWYVISSVSALLLWPWQYYFTGKQKVWRVLAIILQVLFFFMLSARMLIVVFFLLLIPIYIIKIFRHTKLTAMQIGATVLIFIAIGTTLLITDNPIKKRYSDIFQKDISKAWLNDYSHIPQKDFNNLTLRLMVWRFGFENMQEHNLWLLGAGNGDAQDLQNQKLAQHGIDVNNPDPALRSEFYNINMHNMWFQSLLMIGLPGLFVFCLITFTPLLYIRRIPYTYFFIVFHVTSLFFLFQEAALQTQAGVVYYTFFSLLFWNIFYTNRLKLVEK